ncbi:MAG: hypothetical protein AAFO58_08350, partial [Pseudomonadota bacterium]
AYIALAVVQHAMAGPEGVWTAAAVLLVLMTVTYPVEALARGEGLPGELAFAVGLSLVALIGLAVQPLFIIAAIVAHGALDIAKHRGLGVPFHPQYLFACAGFDFAYGAALLAYFIATSGGAV